MTGGFYLLHRGWLDHPIFERDSYCERAAWVWLIEHAAYAPQRRKVRGKIVELQRGQLTAATRYLAKAWGWSEAKVRRYLTRLKTDAMIDAATDAGQLVITIRNYDKYQLSVNRADAVSDAQIDASASRERRDGDANKKEGNQVKEGNEKHSSAAFASGERVTDDSVEVARPKKRPRAQITDATTTAAFESFWNHYPRKVARGAALKAFSVALAKVSLEELIAGADRYSTECAGREHRYVAHPATWLNEDRWADEVPLSDKAAANGNGSEATPMYRRPEPSRFEVAVDKWIDGGRKDPAPKLEDYPEPDWSSALARNAVNWSKALRSVDSKLSGAILRAFRDCDTAACERLIADARREHPNAC